MGRFWTTQGARAQARGMGFRLPRFALDGLCSARREAIQAPRRPAPTPPRPAPDSRDENELRGEAVVVDAKRAGAGGRRGLERAPVVGHRRGCRGVARDRCAPLRRHTDCGRGMGSRLSRAVHAGARPAAWGHALDVDQRATFAALVAAATRARPSGVRGPVLSPPCILHRPLRGRRVAAHHTAGAAQGCPSRHRAPHGGRATGAASDRAADASRAAWRRWTAARVR